MPDLARLYSYDVLQLFIMLRSILEYSDAFTPSNCKFLLESGKLSIEIDVKISDQIRTIGMFDVSSEAIM